MPFQPLPHTVVALDVVASGTLDDQMLLATRADVRMIIGSVLAQQGIDIASLETHDLGDGMRLIVPGVVTPPSMLDPFVPNLDTALRQHRKRTSAPARLRLRVSVHHGLVHQDGGQAAGETLRIGTRLLDAQPVRDAIRLAEEANLVLVVSKHMYESVVRHGYGLDPALYQQVPIREKETETTAWIYVPGYTPNIRIDGNDDTGPKPQPPAAAPFTAPPAAPPAAGAARSSSVGITAHTAQFHGPVVGGDFAR